MTDGSETRPLLVDVRLKCEQADADDWMDVLLLSTHSHDHC